MLCTEKYLLPNIYVNSLIRKYSKERANANLLFSPVTDLGFFRLINEGFKNTTRSEMDFYFDSLLSGNHPLGNIMKTFQTESKIFIRKNVEIRNEVAEILKYKYMCNIELTDTNNTEIVLNWLMKYLKNDILKNPLVLDSPAICSVNSFRFDWDPKIEINVTNEEQFHTMDAIVNVAMLNFEGQFNYVEEHNFLSSTILEIPFSNKNTTMLILLPNEDVNVKSLANQLHPFSIVNAVNKMKMEQVQVSIPKFTIDNIVDIKTSYYEYFPNATSFCEFSKLTSHPSYINKLLANTYLEINGESTIIRSATACDIVLQSIFKEMHIDNKIKNRFAKTVVTHKFENINSKPQETVFSVIIPENAYITEFVMVIDEKKYISYIKEKQDAKEIYDKAFADGKSAAHIEMRARHSNKFTISITVAAESKAEFILTYEEFLQRKLNQYEVISNIYAGQLLDVLNVTVTIEENSKLKYVKIPSLRSGNEIKAGEIEEDVPLICKEISNYKAVVKFNPDLNTQRELMKRLDKHSEDDIGVSGQFVVQYDVDVDPKDGEIFVNDGYFVHFYIPDDLPPLKKHVVFTLDVSSSMEGRPIECAKDSMMCILDQIQSNDLVSIVEYNHDILVRNIAEETSTLMQWKYNIEDTANINPTEPFAKYQQWKLPIPVMANKTNIDKAKAAVRQMCASGSTNISEALLIALYLVKLGEEKYLDYQPIIVFLTDGAPSCGITNAEEIIKLITRLNKTNHNVPIFTLSFGEVADKQFLRQLSFQNFAFSKHIYEATDASLQMQQFYTEISAPLLANVSFCYENEVESLTKVNFPIYFRGTDIVICGKYIKDLPTEINCRYSHGELDIMLKPQIQKTVAPIERLWAFVTLKQLLEERECADDKSDLTKKALELAIKYSFVTEITSLIVVKPDDKMSDQNTENSNEGCLAASTRIGQGPTKRITKKRVIKKKSSKWASDKSNWCEIESVEDSVNNEHSEDVAPIQVPTIKIFKANRPFIIIIQQKVDDKIVIPFVGVIENPKQ